MDNTIKKQKRSRKPRAKRDRHSYVPSSEVMEYFNVANCTITRWIKEGCPCISLGWNYRFVISDVEAWLFSRTRQRVRELQQGG